MIRVAAGFIENLSGELLLSLRPEGKSHAGLWEFPGGKIEAGESPIEALKRELQEELHLDVRPVEQFGIYHFSYPEGAAVELYFFRVTALGVPKQTEASSKIAWFQPEAVLNLKLVQADQKPIEDYLKRFP